MAHAPYLSCDNPRCRKPPIQHDKGDETPKGWRLGVSVPFPTHPNGLGVVKVDVCSPGCMKEIVNSAIDTEWRRDDRGIPDLVLSGNSSSEGSERLFEERPASALDSAVLSP